MEIPTAIIVDLERLLSMLDARAERQNVVYLELERAKRAAELARKSTPCGAQHRPLTGPDREKQTGPDWEE
jgi:hypothetical protein